MGLNDDLAQEKRDATLSKEDVIALLPKNPSKNTQVQRDSCSIVSLFKEDDELDVISNTTISPYLQSIADTTKTNGLKKANKDIIVKSGTSFEQR